MPAIRMPFAATALAIGQLAHHARMARPPVSTDMYMWVCCERPCNGAEKHSRRSKESPNFDTRFLMASQ